MRILAKVICFFFAFHSMVMQTDAQRIDTSKDRVKTSLKVSYKYLGTIKPRTTNDIVSSNWILGCETLDRDMTDYHQYKEYIAPLGIKRLRMQAGWAKTEREKGRYNWAWLDSIINDAADRGLQPWLQTSYGNPIYEGGGGMNLSGGIPTSLEALAAWDKWVDALVKRYKGKVKEWEIWNEPNFGDNTINPPTAVANLNIRTAEIIKRNQPNAIISGLSMGHIDLDYADVFFKTIHAKGKMHLFDNMTYHDYVYNPDANYHHVADLRRVLDRYAPKVKLRQGENGCPSMGGPGRGAIGDYDWSELTQAKWILRRMLGDLGHDIECSILGIIDMNYGGNAPIKRMNVKGIIESDSTRRALRPKTAYYSMQHITSVFDHSLQRIKKLSGTYNTQAPVAKDEIKFTKSTDRSIAIYAYEHVETSNKLFAIWSDEYIPTDNNSTREITFRFINASFQEPVYVDMITGGVYEIPKENWEIKENMTAFSNIPVYDAPILIVEKQIIRFQ